MADRWAVLLVKIAVLMICTYYLICCSPVCSLVTTTVTNRALMTNLDIFDLKNSLLSTFD